MFADALNPIIAMKSMKENWKIKGKIIYKKRLLQTTDHCKRRRDYRNHQNGKEQLKLYKKIVWFYPLDL